eukprot:31397-Pelagococcus_subviridis.AAC.5
MQFHQRISGSTCVASIRSFQVKYFCRRSWLTSSHQRTHLRRALRADTTSASIPRLLPATGRRLAEAVEVLRQEKILAIPTARILVSRNHRHFITDFARLQDTLYGLAASASSENSIKKLYAAKQRPITVPLAICVSDAQDLLPGPFTILLARKTGSCLTAHLNPGLTLLALARKYGHALALTSANESGSSSTLAVHEFEDIWIECAAVLDGGQIYSERSGSTIVDLSTPGTLQN